MLSITFGAGLSDDQFDALIEKLTCKLGQSAGKFFREVLDYMLKHSKMIAACSKWQYKRLKKDSRTAIGRVRKVGDTLDKVQLHGRGLMAPHVVRNGGITAKTFMRLTEAERDQINNGQVLIGNRGDVLQINTSRLNEKQMALVVRSSESVLGAKVLTPQEQKLPRGRKPPKYYAVKEIFREGHAIIVTAALNKSVYRTRFMPDDIANFVKVAKSKRP
ncbi:MAG: hypothetical protein WBE26_09310 [Phycisphaerae bacterium]